MHRLCTLVCALLLLAGCSSTTMEKSWSDTAYSGPPLHSFLVMGVVRDDTTRRSFEQTFCSSLRDKGVSAVPSYTLAPQLPDMDRDALTAMVRQAGADALLIARLVSVDKEETYVPPRVEVVPTGGYVTASGYYQSTFRQVYVPGYTQVNTVVRIESKIFAAADERLVWAGASRSFNPDSVEQVTRELAELVIKELRDNGLLKN